MTDLKTEQQVQAMWRLKPGAAGLSAFDLMVRNEFVDEDRQRAREGASLRHILGVAASKVPYYRDIFAKRRLRPEDFRETADLTRLPLLSKTLLQEQGRRLKADSLPAGEEAIGVTSSSGTTGRPAKVILTKRTNRIFAFLLQRQLRWLRWEPRETTAEIRLPSQMPAGRDGELLRPDGTLCRPGWRYVGRYFETGPYVGFSVFNPVEEQLDWLARERPAYLTAYSETLEQLAIACDDRRQPIELKGLRAISEQLTEAMHRRIVGAFGAPVGRNYGLNEIGIVAGACEAGRYHVNTEHCLVEVVDLDGQICKPGESGRLVVTALTNMAMPLIRYDTDDIAQVVEGACPCGRNLPSFGSIVGRYSRIAYLPEGTLGFVGAIRQALEEMPQELARGLRQYQVHQSRDGGFEMRLCTTGALPPAFTERITKAWKAAVGARDLPLSFVEVAEIERPPSGKYQDFTSDFFPAIESELQPGRDTSD